MQYVKNLILFTVLAFTIASLLSSSITLNSFAEKGGNDKAKGIPSSCDNSNGKAAIKNPNCSDPPPSTVNCTYNEDEEITAQDLVDALGISNSVAQSYIDTAENINPDERDSVVNNDAEFEALNIWLEFENYPICT